MFLHWAGWLATLPRHVVIAVVVAVAIVFILTILVYFFHL